MSLDIRANFGAYAPLYDACRDADMSEQAKKRFDDLDERLDGESYGVHRVAFAVKEAVVFGCKHPLFYYASFDHTVMPCLEAARISRIELWMNRLYIEDLETLRVAGWQYEGAVQGWQDEETTEKGALFYRPVRTYSFGSCAEEANFEANFDPKPPMTRVFIDTEYNPPDWWSWGGAELWDSEADELILRNTDAERLRRLAQSLPFWNSGPEHAKNPLIFEGVENEKERE